MSLSYRLAPINQTVVVNTLTQVNLPNIIIIEAVHIVPPLFINAESVEFAGYNKPSNDTEDEADRDFPTEFDEIISERSPS